MLRQGVNPATVKVMSAKRNTPLLTKLLDEVEAVMKSRGEDIGDLRRFLKKPYAQVYDWIKTRRYTPNGEITEKLRLYLGTQDLS